MRCAYCHAITDRLGWIHVRWKTAVISTIDFFHCLFNSWRLDYFIALELGDQVVVVFSMRAPLHSRRTDRCLLKTRIWLGLSFWAASPLAEAGFCVLFWNASQTIYKDYKQNKPQWAHPGFASRNIHRQTGTRGSISQETLRVRKFKMAMKLTTESIKLRFPNVPNISTEQLYELMKAESSKRKLVLLVSCTSNSAPVLQKFWSICVSLLKIYSPDLQASYWSQFTGWLSLVFIFEWPILVTCGTWFAISPKLQHPPPPGVWHLQTADWRPQTADCRLQTADCRLQTGSRRKDSAWLLTVMVLDSR